jgi:hypothetical protein
VPGFGIERAPSREGVSALDHQATPAAFIISCYVMSTAAFIISWPPTGIFAGLCAESGAVAERVEHHIHRSGCRGGHHRTGWHHAGHLPLSDCARLALNARLLDLIVLRVVIELFSLSSSASVFRGTKQKTLPGFINGTVH